MDTTIGTATLGDSDLTYRTTDLLELADVKRWGVIKTLRDQSVAEHSFNVAVLVMEICDRLGINGHTRAASIEWSLLHDMPEILTGDIDGKFKRQYPNIRPVLAAAEEDAFNWWCEQSKVVHPTVNAIVKLADKIEATQYIRLWGRGPRADAAYQELRAVTFGYVPHVADKAMRPEADVMAVTRQILDHSTTEAHNIQERMVRGLR